MSGVTIINSFEVPVGREEEFLQLWETVSGYVKSRPGYLGHNLFRAIAPDAPFRFVNVARWASKAQFEGAHDATFRHLVEQPAWSAFVPHRALFEVVRESESTGLGGEQSSRRETLDGKTNN